MLGLSRRGAENYGSVYRHHQPYPAQLVEGGVKAAVLSNLAVAAPEQIKEPLAVRTAGEEMTSKKMKAMQPLHRRPFAGG